MKKIGIIGSSGGNLYNLGGKEPRKLLGEIITQANSADIKVTRVLFVAAKASMDNVKDTTQAVVYTLEQGELVSTESMSLKEANAVAKKLDAEYAATIEKNELDGLVVMSADVKNVNAKSLEMAAKTKLPVVGTGGTSIAYIQSLGANVISASGTTGTTNRTRAIAAVTSLAKAFGLKYRPVIGQVDGGSSDSGSVWERFSIRGIMLSAIPGFIAMALVLALSRVPFLSELGPVFSLLIGALPVLVAVIAAKQISGLDEVGIVAGVVAGVLSVEGGIIGGIVGGLMAGIFALYLVQFSIKNRVPGTTANIIAGGLGGLAAGLLVYFFIAPSTEFLGDGVRQLIDATISLNPALAGLVAGLLIWPAILVGAYHAAILPIVLLEMEVQGVSFLGAVDMVGLVMVSAGITLANIVAPRVKTDRAIAVPGFAINMGFGTFVEAAYPFMFSNKLVFAAAIVSSGLAGLTVGLFNVRGTAYLPSLVAPALSDNPLGFAVSMAVGLGAAFVLTVLANRLPLKGSK